MIASLQLTRWQASGPDGPPDAIVVRMSDCDLWIHQEEATPIAEAIEIAADVKSETGKASVGSSKQGMHLPPRGGWTVRDILANQGGCLILRGRDGDYWIPNDQIQQFVTALKSFSSGPPVRITSASQVLPPREPRVPTSITLRRSRHVLVTDAALDAFQSIVDAQLEELSRLLLQFGDRAPKQSRKHCETVLAQMNWLRARISELRRLDGVLMTIDPPPSDLLPPAKELLEEMLKG
jgi:hypothetical protein